MDHLYEAVSSIIVTLSNLVWGWPEQLPLIVVLLVGTGVVTTFRLGWIQIRYFRHGVRVIRGEYDDVMAVLTTELKTTFEQLPKGVFVIKMLNNPIAD